MAAVAAQLDDNGARRAWIFAGNPARLPDLRVGELPQWLELRVRCGQSSFDEGAPVYHDGLLRGKHCGARLLRCSGNRSVRRGVPAIPARRVAFRRANFADRSAKSAFRLSP
ncbi:hypothetical protein ACWEKR_04515 [Nocardia sp. NPDC004573]